MSGPEQESGQVSEVGRLDPEKADSPISDSEQVTKYPTGRSGEPDVGEESGPDARTGSDHDDFPDERSDDGLPPSD
ncbi:MAG TPA: hypothetical protein VHO29_19585 [Marmoricola sp.]|nr:hypothetical protein [Marmoricola sp.]